MNTSTDAVAMVMFRTTADAPPVTADIRLTGCGTEMSIATGIIRERMSIMILRGRCIFIATEEFGSVRPCCPHIFVWSLEKA